MCCFHCPHAGSKLCRACCGVTSQNVFQCFYPHAGMATKCLATACVPSLQGLCELCAMHLCWFASLLYSLALHGSDRSLLGYRSICTHAVLLGSSDVTCRDMTLPCLCLVTEKASLLVCSTARMSPAAA